jgi:hypothetical protein
MGNPVVRGFIVARGFIPVRLQSSRETILCGVSGKFELQDLGLLCSPSGMNPLATNVYISRKVVSLL